MDARSGLHRYRVSSSSVSSQQSVLQLKLTDASLKAIEEFQKTKNQTKGLFKIKVSGSNGEAHVPNVAGTRNFKFSVSNILMDQLSSFECLSELHNQMFVTGPMSKKLTVLATDDVYKTTKEKMTLAEEESKKNCTKVIKQNESSVGRIVRKPARPASLTGTHSSRPGLSGKPQPAPSVQNGTLTGGKRHSVGPVLPSTGHSSLKPVHSPLDPRPTSVATNHTSSREVKPLGNSSVVNYPYRDRIIHLLAVRPHKKIELQQILEKDGVSEREKQSWTSVLGQVAIFNHHDNCFSLSPSYYSEVKEDWPFYAEETRKEVKRKLVQFNEGLRSVSVSPVLSPCSNASSSQGASPTEAKRCSPSDDYCSMPSKKQRIAHTQKNSMQNGGVTSMTSSHPSPVKADHAVLPQTMATAPARPEKKAVPDLELEEGQENVNISGSKDNPSSLRNYVPIVSLEQRHKYKAEFYREYSEYRTLYNRITERTQIFKKLHEEFERSQGSLRESVRNQIYVEYEKLQQDGVYVDQKQRYEYLEKKLNHLKKLVQEFDRRQLSSAS